MAGIADTLGVKSRGQFELATRSDEPEIRRLLAQNPMAGSIRLSQEPAAGAALGDGIPHLCHQTLIARDASGQIVAVGARRVSRMVINGQPQSVGYLGALRLARQVRRHPRFLLAGYAKLRELHESAGDCRFYLTSILTDNLPARRILEAGIRGMPAYRPIARFVTLVMPVRRYAAPPRDATDLGRIAEMLARNPEQFAPVWNARELASHAEFVIQGDACGALWDQDAFRQNIVRGYAPLVARWRPVVNMAFRFVGRPTLPNIGQPLRTGFVSRLTSAMPEQAAEIAAGLHNLARSNNLRYLIAGFDVRDPRLAILRRAFGGVQLHSRLYAVYWPDGEDAVNNLDDRIAGPEAGTL